MLATKSAWLLPTGETIYLGDLSHAEVVIKFLTGLFLYDEVLARYCLRDVKRFHMREDYKGMELKDVIEDYAVLCLRWIKIGNAHNYNNNRTVTIANYDTFKEKIIYYSNIGFQVNVILIKVHYYETISQKEYDKLNVRQIIDSGNNDYDAYEKL